MRFNKLDLNLLVVLDALLSTRSVSRAAEKVFLSQPATSLSLSRLRSYFEDELLVSVGKTQVLTPLAAELIKPVRDVLLQIQTVTRARPSFDPATSSRRFVIESSDYVISVLLSEVVRRVAEVAPMMQFDLRAINTLTHQHLDGGEIELLITPEFSTVEGHPSEPLFEDTFSCLMWRGHRLAKAELTVEDYLDAGHVGVEWIGGRRVTYDAQLLTAARQARRQEIIAPNFTLVPQLLEGTQRIATLPTRLATAMSERFDVVVLPCPLQIPGFTELLQWHKHHERDPGLVWLRSILKETAVSLAARQWPSPENGKVSDKRSRRKR
ncbi:LysR family transcriptional regulator [Pelomonas sp. KK5]|uniref:LysR family transcriptional regulator n=1 Tax=Pelomonas sp. KK5 TaxID=1855730 RepID=UPI0009FA87C3|nr:LysR family transcriptional regulator [Pelomonas sp. KK5]